MLISTAIYFDLLRHFFTPTGDFFFFSCDVSETFFCALLNEPVGTQPQSFPSPQRLSSVPMKFRLHFPFEFLLAFHH
jgi:hypothetical protein